MKQEGLRPNDVTRNVLISAFGKSGHVDQAMDLFNQMKQEGVSPSGKIWNTLLTFAFGQSGNVDKAMELCTQMQEEGFEPDEETWSTLISGCSK